MKLEIKFLKKLINSLQIFLNLKINFFPPSKSKVLIFDNMTVLSGYANIFFKKKDYTIFYTRREQINFFILLKALIFIKYFNLKKNYIYYYLKHVDPKIVYTSIDNNPTFYLLKTIFPKPTYISDQNGFERDTFYNFCLRSNEKYKCDYYFVFNKLFKKKLNKVINSKFVVSGNSKNNNFTHKTTQKQKKIITYISSKIRVRPELEKLIFSRLLKYCSQYNFRLFFLDRPNQNNKNYLKKFFPKNNWTYLKNLNLKNKYSFLAKCKLVAFSHSTLGYECLSKGFKCVSFNNSLFYKTNSKKNKSGLFWCSPDNYSDVKKKINKILSYKKKYWQRIYKKYSKDLLVYDENNVKIKKVINNYLSK